MPLSVEAGKALGKLYRDLSNPRWIAETVASTIATITVINWAGQQVTAKKKGKLVHKPDAKADEVHVGDIYHCADGHDYIHSNGKTYRYNKTTDAWHNA